MQIEAPQSIGKGTYAHWASEQCGRIERKGKSPLPSLFPLFFWHWKEAKKLTKKLFICSVSTLNQGSRKAALSAHWSAINDFFVERLYDCSMSKRITKNCTRCTIASDWLFQISFSLLIKEKRKVNSGCTPSTRYMVMHYGTPVLVFLHLCQATKKEI